MKKMKIKTLETHLNSPKCSYGLTTDILSPLYWFTLTSGRCNINHVISIQIMTDHKGNRKSIWLERFRRAWKQLTIARGATEGNSQLFPGPTKSRDQDGIFCWRRDQSLFVLL